MTQHNSLVLVAAFQAKAGYEDRLREALTNMVEPSLAEAGCLGYRPLSDPAVPGAMICLEEWTDAAALEFHFQTPHFIEVAKVLNEILAVPFALRRLSDLPEAA
ncbi:putative quinol monooxygenase [Mycetocola saprophilus]|uniref:putative quinol monooxygenase n=1 Tax=Mycetocola saprophilus TaxID=76636 RepID=UPI0004BE50CA|nr:putative quinol monooxygenase [Mycetocola saprophilus]